MESVRISAFSTREKLFSACFITEDYFPNCNSLFQMALLKKV